MLLLINNITMEKINKKNDSTWVEYHMTTKDLPPSPLLVESFSYLKHNNHALDLGAGGLKDSKFLLSKGFKNVTIVDSEATVSESAKDLPVNKVEIIITPFDQFNFPKEEYDLVNAQFSLPFNPPSTFNRVIEKLKSSLKMEGIFTGQLFGINDEWNVPGKNMTFNTESEVRDLFSDMDILKLIEVDRDGTLAKGTPKHWNYFNVIARKI